MLQWNRCKEPDPEVGNDAVMPKAHSYAVQERGGGILKKSQGTRIGLSLAFMMFLAGCSMAGQSQQSQVSSAIRSKLGEIDIQEEKTAEPIDGQETESMKAASLLYQGQASIRIITAEGKVIYIDPYAGEGYDLSADLILVTHGHFDHCAVDKVSQRNDGCQVITHKEAIQNGEHKVFELGYVTVEAVEAGYNPLHDVSQCVGYILTFSDGKSVYVTGDTSTTEQMPLLAEKQIDYAFFCCDGVYNMGLEEAAECAGMVGAKYNVPYHITTTTTGRQFDRGLAEQFYAESRLIIEDGEEIIIE